MNHRGHGVNPELADLNHVSEKIILAAIRVHRELGPGLLESTYEACLAHERTAMGLEFDRQKACPVHYRGLEIDCGYRIDLLVQDSVVVELKAIDKVLPIHKAQLLSCLKMSNLKLGLLINFNVTLLKKGIQRFVH